MALKAEIKTPLDRCKTIKTAHSAATVANTPILVGSRLCIPEHSEDADVENLFIDDCPVVKMPKTSALAITAGDILYWDDTNKEVNKTAGGNTKCGRAIEDAANPSSYVYMDLMRMQA